MTTVAVTQDDDIGRAIPSALDELAVEPLVRGKVVAVKPNETWASADDISGVTQADTLAATLDYLRRFEPKELIVSGGAGAAETADVFRYAGLDAVIDRAGATFVDHNRPPFVELALEYAPDRDVAGPQQSIMVNPRVLEYETLVALSQLKLHGSATVTMALKNIAMSFPAADYYGHPRSTQTHEHQFFDDLHSFIVAMARRFPVDLAITTGHPAMIATGPLGGLPVETGLVIASTDPVAADVVGAKLLGFGPQAVRYLWEAGRLGLGVTDVRKMTFPLLDMRAAIEAFTERAYGKRMTFEHA